MEFAMMRYAYLSVYTAIFVFIIISAGCSAEGGGPVIPGTESSLSVSVDTSTDGSGRILWGLYDIDIDPVELNAEVRPLRQAEFTCNITKFLQPPLSPIQLLSISIDPFASDPPTGLIVCDITVRHPFPGAGKLRGFDIRGVCMGDGTPGLDYDPGAKYPVEGDTILLNADGYTRWFNIYEFGPPETIFAYTKGAFAPGSYLPTARLNGYRVFADELEADDELILDPADRGTFSIEPGVNTRRYEIQFPMIGGSPQFHYAYAIDANWAKPDPDGAPDYPVDSFPPEANCAEAYMMTVSDAGSTAYYVDEEHKGGSLLLDIEVFDWQSVYNNDGTPGEVAGLWLEGEVVDSPVDVLAGATALPGGETSSVFQIEISDLTLTHSGPNEIWIIAENADPNTYEPQIDGDTSMWAWSDAPLAAYLRTTVDISNIQPQFAPEVLAIDPVKGKIDETVNASVTGQYFEDGCQVELRESGGAFVVATDNENWIDETEVTCDLDLTGAPYGLYDVAVINPSTLEGSLVEGFEVSLGDFIYVDDSNVSGDEDGSMAHPFDTIQEGLAAAGAGYEVWVDDSGSQYDGPVTLVSGVILKSVNWDGSDGDDEASILYKSSSAAVVGADNSTIDGFEIDAQYCGIECDGTSPQIRDCTVVNLDYSSARGIWLHDGSHARLNGVGVHDVSKSDHDPSYGIFVQDCKEIGGDKVIIEHADIHSFTGAQWDFSYGIYVTKSAGIEIDDCTVSDISCGLYGYSCGILVDESNDATITDCTVYDIEGLDYSDPRGIMITESTGVQIYHCDIHGVTCGSYSVSHGILITVSDGTCVKNSIIHDISGAHYDTVFGVQVVNSDDVSLINSVIFDIKKNHTGPCGGYGKVYGLHFSECADLDARNLIVHLIQAPYPSQQAYGVGGGTDTYVFDFCDVFDCTTALYENVTPGPDCISANPKWIDFGVDFHLDTGSSCIDTGDPAINDTDGSQSDMGAYGGPGGEW